MRRCPSSRRYLPGSLRSRATTGGSTMPTSRIDATIWAYFGVFLIAAETSLRGWIRRSQCAARLPRKPFSPLSDALCVRMSGLRSGLDACGKVSREGVEPLSSQQRHEVLVDEQLSQGLCHEDQSISGGFGLSDQKALAVDVLLIGSNERVR